MATESKTKVATKSKKPAKSQGKLAESRGATGPLMTPFNELELAMDRMLDRMFPSGWRAPWRESALMENFPQLGGPRVDVVDHDGEVIVRAEVPGISKEDLDVSLSDDSVTIRGSFRQEDSDEQGTYFRREASHGEFSRTLTLPSTVDADTADASLKDGILELKLQKMERAKRRSISIS